MAAVVFQEELLASTPAMYIQEAIYGPKEVDVSSPFGVVHRVRRK